MNKIRSGELDEAVAMDAIEAMDAMVAMASSHLPKLTISWSIMLGNSESLSSQRPPQTATPPLCFERH